MTTLLNQALLLTLVGMGMTFAAIGLLVLGMYAMTALIKDTRPEARKAVVIKVERNLQSEATAKQISKAVFPGVTITPEKSDDRDTNNTRSHDGRYRAAAVAVAVALAAQSASTTAQQANVALADSWNAFVRGRHLAQRQRYYARRT